jgi:hypothetical protein
MTDLEALVVAGYVFADEYRVPARGGRPPLISDAELVALAVCQAAIGSTRIGSSWAWWGGCCRAGFRTCPTSRAGCACSSSCSRASSNASPAGLTQAAPGSPTGRWSASPTTLAARRAAASLAPLATATPSRSTATSTAFGSCSSPTGAGSRSATISRDRTASAVCSSRADPARATTRRLRCWSRAAAAARVDPG